MPKKKPQKGKPKVNKELEGFDIRINEFGELKNAYDLDRINDFLNKTTEDKKLEEREDYEKLKSGEKRQAENSKKKKSSENKDEEE